MWEFFNYSFTMKPITELGIEKAHDRLANYCTVGNTVPLDNQNCLEQIHAAIVVKVIHGGLVCCMESVSVNAQLN